MGRRIVDAGPGRKRLRSEGHSRVEAIELSWKWMEENFPPLTEEQIALLPAFEYMAMSEFPAESQRRAGLLLVQFTFLMALAIAFSPRMILPLGGRLR